MLWKKKSRRFLLINVIYFIFIVATFIGYTTMLQQRMDLSKLWQTNKSLSSTEIDLYVELINSTMLFEFLFIFIFLLMSLYYFYKNRKNRSERAIVKEYFTLQISLIIFVIVLSIVFSIITDVLFIDLLFILFGPIIIFALLLIYMGIGLYRVKKGKINKLRKEK